MIMQLIYFTYNTLFYYAVYIVVCSVDFFQKLFFAPTTVLCQDTMVMIVVRVN